MSDITFRITHSPGLLGFVDRLRPLLEGAVGKVALEIQEDAQARAPVRTGFLRSSIAAQPQPTSDAEPVEWIVDAGAFYGIYVEMGTSRMSARPFLVPAAEAARGNFETEVSAALERALEEAGF